MNQLKDVDKSKRGTNPRNVETWTSGRMAKEAYEKESRLYFESIQQLPVLIIEVKKLSEPYVYLDMRNLIVLLLYETLKLNEWVKLSIFYKSENSDFMTKNIPFRLTSTAAFNKHCSLQINGNNTNPPLDKSGDISKEIITSASKHPSITVADKRMVICGVSSVLRFILKFVCYKLEENMAGNSRNRDLHTKLKQFLGFRGGCLQACAESSIWTKFCEVEMIAVVNEVLTRLEETYQCEDPSDENIQQSANLPKMLKLPESLIRFEYHLSMPVKIHNFRKVAQDLQKSGEEAGLQNSHPEAPLKHDFAEGPILLLSDLILYPSVHACMLLLGRKEFEQNLPKTLVWYGKVHQQFSSDIITLDNIYGLNLTSADRSFSWSVPNVPLQSLYSRDTNRYKPSLRQFTRQADIDEALDFVQSTCLRRLEVYQEDPNFDWAHIPVLAHPEGGNLPISRRSRKCDQLASMVCYALQVYAQKKQQPDFDSSRRFRIVDFCSGGGHVGILMAFLLPECDVVLVENKDESLRRAQERIRGLALTNVFCYQSNLDYFEGKFDLGMALHACGTATDLVLEKCVTLNASFVCCPCCYGSIQENHVLNYPRSSAFKQIKIPLRLYFILCHSSDQTHDEAHEKTTQGKQCMTLIDTDRCLYATDNCYEVKLCKIVPETASPKNHILVGVSKSSVAL